MNITNKSNHPYASVLTDLEPCPSGKMFDIPTCHPKLCGTVSEENVRAPNETCKLHHDWHFSNQRWKQSNSMRELLLWNRGDIHFKIGIFIRYAGSFSIGTCSGRGSTREHDLNVVIQSAGRCYSRSGLRFTELNEKEDWTERLYSREKLARTSVFR